MCSSGSYKATEVEAAQVAATAPPVEDTATAPEVSEETIKRTGANSQKKGTSALKINLNVGGTSSSGSGLSIPS